MVGGNGAVYEHLLERADELQRLDALLGRCTAGDGPAAVIVGPAGLGKTSLLRCVEERCDEQGLRLLIAGGDEFEQSFPFGVARQLFEPVLKSADAAQRRRLLEGAAGLSEIAFGTMPAEEVPAESHAVLHGLYWLAANLAQEQPLVLAVDDAHWADELTLRWLTYTVRRLEGLPVLVLAAGWPPQPNPIPSAFERLIHDESVDLIEPALLTPAAIEHLLTASLGELSSPELVASAAAATGGNPFLVTELARTVADGEPATAAAAASVAERVSAPSIARSVLLRLARIDRGAAELAVALSILGDHAELRWLLTLTGQDSVAAQQSLDAMVVAGIVDGSLPPSFTHSVVRQAIYGDLSASRRSSLHHAAASLLQAEGQRAELVAVHLQESAPLGEAWAVDVLRQAAREARATAATDIAVRYLQRALAEPPAAHLRAELLMELGEAERFIGSPHAVDRFAEAGQLAQGPLERARAELGRGRALAFMGRLNEAIGTLHDAHETAEGNDPELGKEIGAAIIQAAGDDVSLRPVLENWMPRLRASAVGDGAPGRQLCALLAYEAARRNQPLAEVEELARCSRGDDLPDEHLTITLARMSFALSFVGLFDTAKQTLSGLERDVPVSHGPRIESAMSLARGALAFNQGRLPTAESELTTARLLAVEHQLYPAAVASLALLLLVLCERGRHAEAREILAGSTIPPPEGVPFLFLVQFAAGCAELAAGELAPGIETVQTAGKRAGRGGQDCPSWIWWRSVAARAMLNVERPDEARELAFQELDLATAQGAPVAIGRSRRTLGLAQGGEGIHHLEESVKLLAGTEARLEHARSQVELGAAMRRRNQRSEAQPLLRAALESATELGATLLAEQARAELGATGARPRRVQLTGVNSLTASELRVARLAATGLTNKGIAQRLFVTIKTVEGHLRGAYGKLEIRSRKELAGALGEDDEEDA